MPRKLLLLLAIVLGFSLTACDGPEVSTPTSDIEAEDEEESEEEESGGDDEAEPDSSQDYSEPVVTGQSLERVELTADLIRNRIDLATGYLLGALEESGRFTYRINLSGEAPRPAYNVLRHAGSIYALGQVNERDPDPEVAQAIGSATNYLIERYVRPPVARFDWLAVFSRPDEESLETDEPEAKLGGAGLALLAMDAARDAGADVSVDTMTGLGEFMIFMQQGDGSFHSKYSESEGYLEFRSLYYPGEAILGFIKLYEADPDPKWLEAAALGTAALIESRRGDDQLPPDHWLMLAMEPLQGLLDQLDRPPVSNTEIRDHMFQLGLSMINEQELAESEGEAPGSFRDDGSCTPTATRLEALTALWRSMSTWGLESDRERVASSIRRGTEFLLTCQVVEGEAIGGVVRAQQRLESEDDNFNRRQPEIRIDYVQHTISALYGALDALFPEEPGA